jgi:pimeloyl-ACP methyl ester carboxylesterase
MPTITPSDGVRLNYVDEGAAVVFDDCGHAANLDQPERTNAAILEFLR